MNTDIITRAAQQLANDQTIDLLALVATLDSGSLHTLFSQLVDNAKMQGIDIDAAFFLRQAEDVRAQLRGAVDDTKLLDALCNRLSVLQTGSNLSRYCSGKSFHSHSKVQADVVMLGDSITEWAHWHELMPDTRVINRGISGDVTQGMLQRLDGVTNANPKQVFFMAGVNDLSLGFEFDGVVERYQSIVQQLRDRDIEVIVQSTLFVGERLKALNSSIAKLNQINEAWCEEQGIRYIDINQALSQDGLLMQQYTFDDLHLNGPAYQQWYQYIAPFVLAG